MSEDSNTHDQNEAHALFEELCETDAEQRPPRKVERAIAQISRSLLIIEANWQDIPYTDQRCLVWIFQEIALGLDQGGDSEEARAHLEALGEDGEGDKSND